MHNTTLVGFGDSWAHGSGLNFAREKTYLQLAAEQLGADFINYSEPSSSIPHLVLQFQNFICEEYNSEKTYIAVFFLTAYERTFFVDPNTENVIHSSPCKTDFVDQEQCYYRHYTDQYQNFAINTAISALEHLCNFYNIKNCYIPGWQTVNFWPAIDSKKFLFSNQCPVTALFGQTINFTALMNSNCLFLDHTGHPNQQGHQIIADALVEHIIDKFR
jgi:lysophospholipase L1-like esterase